MGRPEQLRYVRETKHDRIAGNLRDRADGARPCTPAIGVLLRKLKLILHRRKARALANYERTLDFTKIYGYVVYKDFKERRVEGWPGF